MNENDNRKRQLVIKISAGWHMSFRGILFYTLTALISNIFSMLTTLSLFSSVAVDSVYNAITVVALYTVLEVIIKYFTYKRLVIWIIKLFGLPLLIVNIITLSLVVSIVDGIYFSGFDIFLFFTVVFSLLRLIFNLSLSHIFRR